MYVITTDKTRHEVRKMLHKIRNATLLILLVAIIDHPLKVLAADGFNLPSQWKLFEFGDQTNPLYTKDNTSELLTLCLTNSGKDAKTCAEVSPLTACINDCSKERLEGLILAKGKVRGFMQQLNNPLKTTAIWLIWTLCCAGGIYLNLKGHFQWANVPLIGNWLLDDPTNGIKFRHYMWMEWITLGNSNIHWKTFMKQDCFVYEWVPLARVPWDRPPTPKNEKINEPSDPPSWTIKDILNEKGIGSVDVKTNGEISLQKSQSETNALYQSVLDEYWEKIYEWSWHRYRNIPEDKRGGKDVYDEDDDE